ncbi:ABC-type oligopeptide transport system substrate-binding subunit [Pseudarthrobacter sulfonivorans]|nr:ABC-type oligopeptide transport system substrate-binding subunit [Pseudarthrobacter sulfonivorans]
MVRIKTQQAVGTALAISSLLALAACSDPGSTAATAPSSASAATAGGKTFNLTPEQNRVKVTVDAAAAALVPEAIKADGKLTGDEENKAKGLAPVEFQYYDDDSASTLALQSGRADLTFGPNAGAAYKAAKDGKTKEVER